MNNTQVVVIGDVGEGEDCGGIRVWWNVDRIWRKGKRKRRRETVCHLPFVVTIEELPKVSA